MQLVARCVGAVKRALTRVKLLLLSLCLVVGGGSEALRVLVFFVTV